MPSNAANPSLGTLQAPLMVGDFDLRAAMCDCAKAIKYDPTVNKKQKADGTDLDDFVKCLVLGIIRQGCVEKKLKDEKAKGNAKDVHAPAGGNYQSGAMPTVKDPVTGLGRRKAFCRPDMVLGAGTPPLAAKDMTGIVEMKFPCNKDDKGNNTALPSEDDWKPERLMGGTMRKCYEKIKTKGGRQKKGGVDVTAVGPTKESCA